MMRGTLGRADQVGASSPLWHGEYGRLAVSADGAAIQCHLCGEWMAALGSHLRHRHQTSAAEYRAMLGLGAREACPLMAPVLRQERAESSRARIGSDEWERFAAARDATNRETVRAAADAVRAGLAPGTTAARAKRMMGSGSIATHVPAVCAEDGCDSPVTAAPSPNSRRNRCDVHQSGRKRR